MKQIILTIQMFCFLAYEASDILCHSAAGTFNHSRPAFFEVLYAAFDNHQLRTVNVAFDEVKACVL